MTAARAWIRSPRLIPLRVLYWALLIRYTR